MTVFFLAQKKKAAEGTKNEKKNNSKTGVDKETNSDGIDDNKGTDDNKAAAKSEGNDETGFDIIKQVVSGEEAEKNTDKKKEIRNTQEETEKKENKEGEFIGKEITSKISFGKKINQLEEALKKLREESTQ